MNIFKIIENEITEYVSGVVQISEGHIFSQYKLVNRIARYQNEIYPDGIKIDNQGNYKYWFNIISPRVDTEMKNIDFDTKDILLYSDQTKDATAIFLLTAKLKEWMRETGQSIKLNDIVEAGSSWGNVVIKKVKDDYDIIDLKNFYVINQTAETLEDTSVIERHILTQSDLRSKNGVWNNVEDVIKNCGKKEFVKVKNQTSTKTQTLYYEIFERNGEVSQKVFNEAQGKKGGSEDKYVLVKIIVAGLGDKKTDGYILYAEEIKEMPYKEYHRGRYVGRWFRQGLYELLFDIQTRANEIGNQIAKALEWSSKIIFRSKDARIVQNIMIDMENGDIVRTDDLQQVEVRSQGIDQLIADWNRTMEQADKLCNSYEITTGKTMPAGTPFRLAKTLDINANKLFDFIREKLGLTIESLFQDWVLNDLVKDIKKQEILRLTGDSDYLQRYYEMVINSWYRQNLISLPPHNQQIAETIKQQKMEELKKRPDILVKLEKGLFNDVKARCRVIITGENIGLVAELDTLYSFISLEQDNVRRTALIEMAMQKKGIDVGALPKSEPIPQQMTGQVEPAKIQKEILQ